MEHRTYGATRTCHGCRFWSELIATSNADTGGQLKALCLNPDSPKYSAYMAARESCEAWKSGHHGAIDEPGPDNVSLIYAQEEGRA
jgi:hypothetical protein